MRMARIPSKTEILEWIAENPGLTAKRDIAKAFGIKGAERIELKRILKELEGEGTLERRRKTYLDPDKLPPVTILMILPPDRNGDQFARPLEWEGEAPAPDPESGAEVEVVRRVIAELPDGPEKDTVRLFYLEGELSAREIAERLGVGKSAITMRLERFRAKVKRRVLAEVARLRGDGS